MRLGGSTLLLHRARVDSMEIHRMRAMQESLLFRSGLLAAGNTDYEIAAELESGRIIRLTPGVYIPASRLSKLTSRDLHLAKVAARLEKCRNLILSHDSAAALWGLPMISGWSNAVHTYSGTQTNALPSLCKVCWLRECQ